MRHVGTVRLAARSDALVRRGALLLEDALRTASLPEAGPGRVLLLRTLRVGVIRADLPPSSLALTLERRVRELLGSAVHAVSPSAPHADVVFFRDDAEPPAALAGRLARGESVSAWFWPLAVPGFHPVLPRDEALRLALFTALRSSAGPSAAVRLVEELHARGGLDALLGALRWQEGPALVRALGGSLPGPHLPPEGMRPTETREVSAPLRAMVASWAESWGAGDARAIWLSAVALVIERRGRLADVRLFERAARMTARLTSKDAAAATRRKSSGEALGSSPPALPTGGEPTSNVLQEEGFAPSPTPGPGLVPTSAAAEAVSEEPSRLRSISGESPTDFSALAERRRPTVTAASTSLPGRAHLAPADPSRAPGAPAFAPVPPPTQQERHALRASSEPPAEPPEWPDTPRPTSVGGLFFLVSILNRLGMSALLEAHPSLIDLDLPDRLLALIAERLGAPEMDPSRVILGVHTREPRPTRHPFALPERLRAQVASEGEPLAFRPAEAQERTLVTDASGRLPLVIAYGLAVAPEHSQPGPTLRPTLRGESDLELLLRGLLTAVRRWCRRRARIGLHTLVRRPARIAATRTHIDVVLDIQHADLRVRSAGLDVDPGWVPWLGRVVRFHYLYGEP